MSMNPKVHSLAVVSCSALIALTISGAAEAGTQPPAQRPHVIGNCPTGSVTFSPERGPVRSTFTISGKDWVADGRVKISLPYGSAAHMHMGGTELNPAVAADGSWKTTTYVNDTPPGSYAINFTQHTRRCDLRAVQTFEVTAGPTWKYDAGRYAGKLAEVGVFPHYEKNVYEQRNFCGPGASQVLISAWTHNKNVPAIETLAKDEKTNPDWGTLANDMVGPINLAIGQKYYKSQEGAGTMGDLSNRIGRDLFDQTHPLITAVKTSDGVSAHLTGWPLFPTPQVPIANHIVTIFGFNFTSPDDGWIYYFETAGDVSGTTSRGRHRMDYKQFWSLVSSRAGRDGTGVNVQVW